VEKNRPGSCIITSQSLIYQQWFYFFVYSIAADASTGLSSETKSL
jgi:hypothetical protein